MFGQIRNRTGMVHMGVGHQYFFEGHIIRGNRLFDALKIAAGVDNGGAQGFFTPH